MTYKRLFNYLLNFQSQLLFNNHKKTNKLVFTNYSLTYLIFEQKNNLGDFQGLDIKEKSLDASWSSSSWWCSSEMARWRVSLMRAGWVSLQNTFLPQSDSNGMNEQELPNLSQYWHVERWWTSPIATRLPSCWIWWGPFIRSYPSIIPTFY